MQTGITQTTFRIGIAMNRLGGKSNTGEVGEDADRYYTDDIQSSQCHEQTWRQIKHRGGGRGMQTGITQTTFRVVVAMNRLGGKSNTREGGEDADRDTDDIQSRHRHEQTRRQIKHWGGQRGCRQVLHRRHSE